MIATKDDEFYHPNLRNIILVNPFVEHALQVWVLQKVSISLFSIVKVLNGNEAVTISIGRNDQAKQ